MKNIKNKPFNTFDNIIITKLNLLTIYDDSMMTVYQLSDRLMRINFLSREDLEEVEDQSLYKFTKSDTESLNLLSFVPVDWNREFVNAMYNGNKKGNIKMRKDKFGDITPNNINLSRKLFEQKFEVYLHEG